MKTNQLFRKSVIICSRGVKDITWLKMEGFIINFCQYFNLKVGVLRQVGGRVWEGNQYAVVAIGVAGVLGGNIGSLVDP